MRWLGGGSDTLRSNKVSNARKSWEDVRPLAAVFTEVARAHEDVVWTTLCSRDVDVDEDTRRGDGKLESERERKQEDEG